MTYDQLLEKVNINALVSPNALRAVIELHKPSQYNANCCSICSDELHDECFASYPCATLKAILQEIN